MAEYIEKQALRDKLYEADAITLKGVKILNQFPPADVRSVVRGRWMPHPDPNCKEWDVCTACGTGCKRREYGTNPDGTDYVTEWRYPYCPNCAADMRGGDAK